MIERPIQPDFTNLKILVAEDSGLSFALIQMLLECLTGCTPDRVCDGQQALERVQCQDYDLVIMDHLMPVMTGVEATRQIRKLVPEWRQPFIAGLSGATTQQDLRAYREAGMDCFLAKPMRLADLRGLLEGVVGQRRQEQWVPNAAPELVVTGLGWN